MERNKDHQEFYYFQKSLHGNVMRSVVIGKNRTSQFLKAYGRQDISIINNYK